MDDDDPRTPVPGRVYRGKNGVLRRVIEVARGEVVWRRETSVSTPIRVSQIATWRRWASAEPSAAKR